MADIVLAHPYIGSSSNLTLSGEVNLDVLKARAQTKVRHHRRACAVQDPPQVKTLQDLTLKASSYAVASSPVSARA
eukprot:767709-Hanusia_phi.AAC.4